MRLSRERHSRRPVPVPAAEHPLVQTAEVNFICAHCGSFYEVVRAKALPDSVDRRITCPTCTGPLPPAKRNSCSNTFFCGKPTAGGVARRLAPRLADASASQSSWQASQPPRSRSPCPQRRKAEFRAADTPSAELSGDASLCPLCQRERPRGGLVAWFPKMARGAALYPRMVEE